MTAAPLRQRGCTVGPGALRGDMGAINLHPDCAGIATSSGLSAFAQG